MSINELASRFEIEVFANQIDYKSKCITLS